MLSPLLIKIAIGVGVAIILATILLYHSYKISKIITFDDDIAEPYASEEPNKKELTDHISQIIKDK